MEIRRIHPVEGPLSAVVEVPGSKSVANRALVCAALAGGRTVLRGLPNGDDTAAMIDCVRALGAQVLDSLSVDGVTIDGVNGRPAPGPARLPARLAGTTSRFITAVAALGTGPYVVDGDSPLRARPMTPLHDALVALGARISPTGEWGHLPVEISGPLQCAGASLSMRGDTSSQFITALMLVGPYIGGLQLQLTTPLVSRSYLNITAQVMAAFGVDGVALGDVLIAVPAGSYGPADLHIEPDASSASYPLAAAAIAGGTVHVPGLTGGSMQGDARFSAVLADMGCDVVVDERGTTVTREGPLRGLTIDMHDLSDLVPTIAVIAPFAHTPTTVHGVGFIREKESDRIGDLCAELRRAGIRAHEQPDGLTIEPGPPHAAVLGTHHDHRLAMAFALLGLVVDGIEIADPDVVTKSWPGYWDMIGALA